MSIINKPRISMFVAGTYLVLVAFIASLIAFFIYAHLFAHIEISGLIAVIALAFVEAIMLLILMSIYRTRYILTEERLILKTTMLIGGSKQISLKDIVNFGRTFIPFGIRLFGASFHGGYYHIPGLGRVFMAITNFNDGVLIKTERGNCIITPKKPEEIIKKIENAITAAQSEEIKKAAKKPEDAFST